MSGLCRKGTETLSIPWAPEQPPRIIIIFLKIMILVRTIFVCPSILMQVLHQLGNEVLGVIYMDLQTSTLELTFVVKLNGIGEHIY